MIQPIFDLLAFEPFSWQEWKFRYFSDIRTNHELSSLKDPKTGLLIAGEDTEMYIPHYKKGNWRYGVPKQVYTGKTPVLLRAPAVKYNGKYLLLDNVHRVSLLHPAFLLLDWVEVKPKERKYVTDLIGDFWD